MKISFKKMLKADKMPIGTFIQIPSEELVEIVAYSGFQYVIIDCEHTYMTNDKVMSLIRTAENEGLVTFVRVPDSSEVEIKKALDMGASGIVVPSVNSAEEARRIVKYAKFPPLGERGACPYVRANHYGIDGVTEFYKEANDGTTIYVLVETPEGFKEIDEIIKVEGIDIVSAGIVDLSVALGLAGQHDHPKVVKIIRDTRKLAHKYGKYCGGFVVAPEEVKKQRDEDIDFLTYGTDTLMISAFYRNACREIKKQLEKK